MVHNDTNHTLSYQWYNGYKLKMQLVFTLLLVLAYWTIYLRTLPPHRCCLHL